jgi:hypothetical protein
MKLSMDIFTVFATTRLRRPGAIVQTTGAGHSNLPIGYCAWQHERLSVDISKPAVSRRSMQLLAAEIPF